MINLPQHLTGPSLSILEINNSDNSHNSEKVSTETEEQIAHKTNKD